MSSTLGERSKVEDVTAALGSAEQGGKRLDFRIACWPSLWCEWNGQVFANQNPSNELGLCMVGVQFRSA